MASNVVRMSPSAMPPQPSQQDWVWDGANWVWGGCPPFPCPPTPPPCPPAGFPTPCPPWFPPPAAQAPWYPGANGGVSFSATPPVNPVRGHFWWNGTTLQLFDGAVWVNIGPGSGSGTGGGSGAAIVSATAPANPALGALWWNGGIMQVWDGTRWNPLTSRVLQITQPSASLGVSGSTPSLWVQLPITATPAIDTLAGWNPSTRQYAPKVAGRYLFLTHMYFGSGQTNAGHGLIKNDSGVWTGGLSTMYVTAAATDIPGAAAATYQMPVGLTDMNGTTDFVRMWGYSDTSLVYPFSSLPILEGYLVG